MPHNFKYNPFRNSFQKEETFTSILPQIIWHITNKCALKCPFCFARKGNVIFNIDKIEEYIHIFKQLGIQKIDISGGEPLLFKHLPILVNELRKNSLYLTITTSSIGDIDLVKWLIENTNLFTRIIISLDAYESHVHDNLRGRPGTFLQVIKLINNIPHENLRINTVLSNLLINPINASKMADKINDLQIPEWCIIQPNPVNIKETYRSHSIDLLGFDKIKDFLINYTQKLGYKYRLIYRYSNNYFGYWILYPNGDFIKHSERDILDDTCISFSKENIDIIISKVKNSKLWLPENQ